MADVGNRCEANVSEPPHYIYNRRCSRRAKVQRQGHQFCMQHGNQSHGVNLFAPVNPHGHSVGEYLRWEEPYPPEREE